MCPSKVTHLLVGQTSAGQRNDVLRRTPQYHVVVGKRSGQLAFIPQRVAPKNVTKVVARVYPDRLVVIDQSPFAVALLPPEVATVGILLVYCRLSTYRLIITA